MEFLTNLSDVLTGHWALLELVYIVTLYAATLKGVVRRFKLRQRGKIKKLPVNLLAVHTAISIIEVLRYHIIALRYEPQPDLFDCILGVMFAVTSIQMQNTISTGNTILVRSSYQATALQMFVGAVGSYAYGGARLHRAVIKNYNQFVYIRQIIGQNQRLRLFTNFHDAYALAVVTVNYLALWEGGFPLGIPTHFLLIGGFALFDQWVTAEIDKR